MINNSHYAPAKEKLTPEQRLQELFALATEALNAKAYALAMRYCMQANNSLLFLSEIDTTEGGISVARALDFKKALSELTVELKKHSTTFTLTEVQHAPVLHNADNDSSNNNNSPAYRR